MFGYCGVSEKTVGRLWNGKTIEQTLRESVYNGLQLPDLYTERTRSGSETAGTPRTFPSSLDGHIYLLCSVHSNFGKGCSSYPLLKLILGFLLRIQQRFP